VEIPEKTQSESDQLLKFNKISAQKLRGIPPVACPYDKNADILPSAGIVKH
jgi:hypothetical protein